MLLLQAMWELLAGESLMSKAELCNKPLVTAGPRYSAQHSQLVDAQPQKPHLLLGLFLLFLVCLHTA